MNEKFVIPLKGEGSVTFTVRIGAKINHQLEELARQSNRSRNELINMALRYALKNARFITEKQDDGTQ